MALISTLSTNVSTALVRPSATLLTTVSVVAVWLCWWVWRFIINPYLHPTAPRELPYLIPILGHAVAFFRDSTELVTRARLQLGDTRDPFALTLAGSTMYVLTKPKDVVEAYRNMTTFSYDIFVQAMMRLCGSSEACIRDMYQPDPDALFPNPKSRPLAVLARDMHTHQLFPGKNLDFLNEKFHEYFAATLDIHQLSRTYLAQHSTKEGVVLPLNQWVSDMFVRGGTEAYFGPALLELDPDLVDIFIQFDDLSWQILYQYPHALAGPMYAARDRLTTSIEQYLELPQDKRTGDAWFTKAMENDMRRLGISTHDIATMTMTIHWGINTNTRRACFWMLSFLLENPTLLEEIRCETSKACTPDGAIDWRCLLQESPRLEAVWNETLRLTASAASVRYVAEDTMLGGKLLRKGCRIMIPNRQLHMDESIFGPNTAKFDSDRFYLNEKLTRSPSWRPFGGGITMCPGRFIARNSTFSFVALLLSRFDISKVNTLQRFPKQDTGTPVLGVMTYVPGTEFNVQLRPRLAASSNK